ncbi:presequence protease [Anaeramoeba flamelloides]|uniref:Presequence protease n=1 Tax=Anaeramoeba flamelloides TaxID=1746091 RepID=A0ABQ8Y0Y9_9EUKA|nr:presequence protease [Anaeramoeba flamelloides]
MSKQFSHWETVVEIPLENNYKVTRYYSKKTQLKVSIIDIPTPIVNGYFVLGTEANDDYGCPHVLEHMIFLGSEEYPYKGIIDSLANRCLGRGTNAWTDVDHTAYTISTAGSEGFLNILPVFLDHILFPTLTEHGFKTEIHHIDEKGEDSGVVYNEMKGRENTSQSLTHQAICEMIFENTSFASETGGKVKELRSLKLETVKEFHEKYYRSSNLELIISGRIKPEEIFERLEKIENKIVTKLENDPEKKKKLESLERPFLTPVPKYLENKERNILFPEDDEESPGLVRLSQRIGKYNDFELLHSMKILWNYFKNSAISPLQRKLIQIEDPYCTQIYSSYLECSESASLVTFQGVPKKKLKLIKEKIFQVLKEELEQGIDLDRIRVLIKKSKLKYLKSFETSPHSLIGFELIGDFLFGDQENVEELKELFSRVEMYDRLIEKGQDYWNKLLNDKIVNEPYAFVIGEPSKERSVQDQELEKERLQKQREELGEEKLKELKLDLEKSIKINDVEVPKEVLLEFKIPDVNKIELIPITSQINEELNTNNLDQEMSKKLNDYLKLTKNNNGNTTLPIWSQFDHINSLFVTIRVIIDTTDLPPQYRKYLSLYKEISFKSPIVRNNKIIEQEQFIKELEKDTIDYSTQIGFYGNSNFVTGSFGQYLIFKVSGEISKYQLLINYLKEIIWQTFFTAEKLKIAAQNLVNDVARFKRNGWYVAFSSLKYNIYDQEKSNHVATNFMVQHKFLTDFLQQLNENKEETIQEFTKFRDLLVSNLKNFKIHVASNLFKIENPKLNWISNSFIPKKICDFDGQENNEKKKEQNFYPSSNNCVYSAHLLNPNYLKKSNKENNEKNELIEKKKNVVIGLGSVDSGFSAHGTNSISSYSDEYYPALMVAIEYLSSMNGFIWKRIRGQGLAYGAGILSRPEHGNLYFYLYRSGNPVLANKEALQIVENLINGKFEFDEDEIDSAKSSLFSSVIKKVETASEASFECLIDYFRNIPNFGKKLLNKIQKVNKEDMIYVLKKYLIQLFDNETNVVLIVNPLKVEETVKGLKEIGQETQQIESLEKFYLD